MSDQSSSCEDDEKWRKSIATSLNLMFQGKKPVVVLLSLLGSKSPTSHLNERWEDSIKAGLNTLIVGLCHVGSVNLPVFQVPKETVIAVQRTHSDCSDAILIT